VLTARAKVAGLHDFAPRLNFAGNRRFEFELITGVAP
jgi:hypothetical protein